MKFHRLSPARVSRSIVAILVISFMQTISGPLSLPTIFTAPSQAATSGVLTDGLVLDWSASDSMDRSAVTGVTPTYVSSGGSYFDFNGSSHYIFPNAGTSVGTSNVLSVFMWVYPKGQGQLLTQQDNKSLNCCYHTAIMEYTSSDQMYIGLWNGGDQTSVNLSSTIATPKNNWYLVGLVYDGSKINGYINGVFAGSTSNFSYSPPGTAYYGIGANDVTNIIVPESKGNMRAGALYVYNKALNGTQALTNFQATQSRFGPTVSNPSSTSNFVNRYSTFSSSACTNTTSGSATCNYQWQLSTDGGSTWNSISGATSSTYTTPLLDSSYNGYQYRMYAWDPGTGTTTALDLYSVTSAATLTVSIPPGSDTDTALSFNGSNQYAEIADVTNSNFDLSGTLTLEAWVYATSDCTSDQAIISKLNSYMMYCGGGNLKWVMDSDGLTWSGSSTTIKLVKNQWHHIAYTKSAASGNLLIYMDGYLAATIATGTTSMAPNNDVFSIGRYNSSNYFQGIIDEVRIYNSQRSQSQIQADMKTYGPVTDSDLRVYYDFNEGFGSTLYNRDAGATASSDLTIYGSPTWDTSTISALSTNGPYSVQTFNRSYLTSTGGWRIPSNVSRATVIIVGGGGGAGAGDSSANNGGPSGGGGGGGVTYLPVQNLTSGSYVTVSVGAGGIGGVGGSPADDATSRNGQSSTFSSSTALGGGGGGSFLTNARGAGSGVGDTTIATGGGSSGAGWTGTGCTGYSPAGGVVASGNNAARGVWGWGGSGGGARGAATDGDCNSNPGSPGPGFTDPVTSIEYGRGGYSNGNLANSLNVLALANRGFGGSSAYNSPATNGNGYQGSAGVIIVRWITALVPTYTKPTNAYLNVGMTETFTTNVSQDSATALLTRTFRWESTTPTANGVYTLIKQGTGAANAAFSWVPTDTTTSGSGYLYRLIVTDSDTAGLFITDSSTAFAVINRALSVVGTSTITKRINLSKNETFTITLGTSTYRPSLSPVIPGITLDTSTAGLAIIKIADTVTVGTYYETLTVIDSVSASVVTPLIIKVAAPPTLLNSGEIVSDGLILNLDAGNSASLIADSGTVTTSLTWKDLSGSKSDAATGAGVNTGGSASTSCSAPTYSSDNGGALQFSGNSNNCYYASGVKSQGIENSFTIEAWFKTTATLSSATGLMSQSTSNVNAPITFTISTISDSLLYFGYFDNRTATQKSTSCGYAPVIGAWTHISGTYDGSNLALYVNGQLQCSTAASSYVTWPSPNNYGLIIGKLGSGATSSSFPGYISTVRLYNKPLTGTQVLSNFNATKARFDTSNIAFLTPSKKYGTTLLDSFTATSGLDTKTVTFSVGDRAGIDWDTTTVTNRVNLSLQESLTVGTYLDTVTVTDSLGQSTYLPVVMTTSKADTLTVTIGTATTVTYNGSAISIYPRATVTGLKWTDTATSLTRFASTLYTETTTVPVNADTYTVRGVIPVFTVGSIDNYLGVIYETSTAVVNKAFQRPLNIFMYGGVVGSPYYIYLQGGSGTGAVTETLTGVATLTGCAINNHFLTAAEQRQGFCEVRVVKAGDQNYFSETQTVQLYFMAFIRNNPTNQSGSGSTIALNGQTSLTIDDSSTVRVPRITGFSKNGSTLTINGQGFGSSPVTVTFERYVDAAVAPTPTGGGTVITVTIPGSAISGPVLVITSGGRDSIDWLDLP